MGKLDGSDNGKQHIHIRERFGCAARHSREFPAFSDTHSRRGGIELLFRLEGILKFCPAQYLADNAVLGYRQPRHIFHRNRHAVMVWRGGRHQQYPGVSNRQPDFYKQQQLECVERFGCAESRRHKRQFYAERITNPRHIYPIRRVDD